MLRLSQVVAYGISINLVEVTWKSKIKAQFPNPNDYSSFMGDFSTATGAVTFTMMILSRWIFKKFGWGVAALITPTVLLITGAHPTLLLCSLVLQTAFTDLIYILQTELHTHASKSTLTVPGNATWLRIFTFLL